MFRFFARARYWLVALLGLVVAGPILAQIAPKDTVNVPRKVPRRVERAVERRAARAVKRLDLADTAQWAKRDTLAELDTFSVFRKLWARPRPQALRLGTDLTYWLQGALAAPFGPNSLVTNASRFYGNVQRFEGTLEVPFNDNLYFLVADFGYGYVNRVNRLLPQTSFQYENRGTFFRIGGEINLLQKTFDDESISIGFRYAQANFSHELFYFGSSRPWGYFYNALAEDDSIKIKDSFRGEFPTEQLTARWFELTTGLRVSVWRGLFLGYTLRVKTGLNIRGEDRLLANELPGYGAVRANVKISFNYHVYYQFPFKKGPPGRR
ncbi:MAG: DUF6048 family protein [Bernardetiaceae bacterium]|jgi:hypothetical protein|nr:DUF6048 family protein [Bernardetiaceae bacterium]